MYRGWRRILAAAVSCHEICRDALRISFSSFTWEYTYSASGVPESTDACVPDLLPATRSAALPSFSSLFCLLLPLTRVALFRVIIFALKHSYVTRCRVIRHVIRRTISYFFERVRLFLLFIMLFGSLVQLSGAIYYVIRELFLSNALLDLSFISTFYIFIIFFGI